METNNIKNNNSSLFQTESAMEEQKWDQMNKEGETDPMKVLVSSGGFFLIGNSEEKGKPLQAQFELFRHMLRIKMDDKHINGDNIKGREIVKDIDLRDILSAVCG